MNKILMNMFVMFAITTIPWQMTYILRFYVPTIKFSSTLLRYLLALFYVQIVSLPIILFYQSSDYRSRVYILPIFETASASGRKMSTNFRMMSTASGFWIIPGGHRRQSNADDNPQEKSENGNPIIHDEQECEGLEAKIVERGGLESLFKSVFELFSSVKTQSRDSS